MCAVSDPLNSATILKIDNTSLLRRFQCYWAGWCRVTCRLQLYDCFFSFKLVAVAAASQYYFRFQIGWHHLSSKDHKLSANQISTTYLNQWPRTDIYNYFWFEKSNSPTLDFYFRFRFLPHHRDRHVYFRVKLPSPLTHMSWVTCSVFWNILEQIQCVSKNGPLRLISHNFTMQFTTFTN